MQKAIFTPSPIPKFLTQKILIKNSWSRDVDRVPTSEQVLEMLRHLILLLLISDRCLLANL